MNPLLKIFCKCCGILFYICRCCYRGHVYCGPECRKAGYRETRKAAQEKYRKTEKGKKQHRNAENRRRYRVNKESRVVQAVVKTCICLKKIIASIFNKDKTQPVCNYCGKEGTGVNKFPKRSYGKTNPGVPCS
ncbi:Uncharacterized protein dnl_53440 [Desulfonema limicola]|uniref:Uncharacterized protein n=1 Tax=Desulfonema limicola TaxID=45656 RepID=A0A975B497_9BACT|nr:hypothetical protein [Desulfonema limicola]QTA77847.1 Uncharacterized protein dnl_00450 [Desulfonema limicola]QTA77859.1 Uncharacterized protein dnl_00570 [Desulfonema limicola]QTA78503.1 Uncharacterized protein dnl_07260 [Desulfonema limicola]QTA80550.1 Uncharacterized protein dnl_28560 [Desulfonema limicola]QTA81297.1 Uncharacterized protein dnl_36300 [Desulfonema limicola]